MKGERRMDRGATRLGRHLAWPGEIPITSLYTAGAAGQIFFAALRDRGVLVASRCAPCGQVYLPAREFCERCFAELREQVEIPPRGVLRSFTFCYVDPDGTRLEPPEALALAQMEGATTLLLHRLLDVREPSEVEIGSRLEAVIRPRSKRIGSILDIEGFRLSARG
jgi:uncharacterized OB-fold protein